KVVYRQRASQLKRRAESDLVQDPASTVVRRRGGQVVREAGVKPISKDQPFETCLLQALDEGAVLQQPIENGSVAEEDMCENDAILVGPRHGDFHVIAVFEHGSISPLAIVHPVLSLQVD